MARRNPFKTTKADYKRFCKYCDKYIKKSKYTHWDVDYSHEDIVPEHMAENSFDEEDKTATITLNTTLYPIEVTASVLEETAYHEVCHIILARLLRLSEERFTTEKDLRDEEHDVIKAMGRLQFNKGGV
jgi:hypothetical protein